MAEAANTPKNRPKRTPVGVRSVLPTKQREGYQRRVVNDVDDRIEMFEAAGYSVVRDKTEFGEKKAGDPSQLGSAVAKPVGGGVRGVLMEIKNEYYQEDQDAKEQRIRDGERAMHEKVEEINRRAGNRYEGMRYDE